MNTQKRTRATELLTPARVAEILAVRPGTLNAWRTRGEGPAFVKVGRLVRYYPDALVEWIVARSSYPGHRKPILKDMETKPDQIKDKK